MRTLSVGIGCRLHSPADQIEAAVRAALGAHGFDEILTVASVDSKAHEAGLLEFCARHALPLTFFSTEQLAAIPVTAITEPSTAAREHLGVDGVCEPCALLAAAAAADSAAPRERVATRLANALDATPTPAAPRARLLVRKTIHAGVTVAIASTRAHTGRQPAPHTSQEQDLP
ncbi:cobalamin biosynthesis protein CbiG [Paraburkholderia ginsengiterrae]|uniref:Cobalamin biosynthesis protein CbiG n=1 Tax=Paraburkholderia ginsengiterrae TaxID=1462993 RepID=A0A1A9N7K5_9BURK|nr:cobalamin biosynthesis protein [Paraburkholderia ginsengiterrae]OAJ52577.1 cobalamin biosynthesis protein CbiG [Paraburkholderia ginsengiterrae]OAJ59162.1 cobalamin biosynthesis protein CbiG [Paraburkholderia ginsengiterrae]